MGRTDGAQAHDVVIVGGGPTGLMLAAELALARVDALVVERRTTQDLTGSRSRGLHARTIEVLDQRGVAERFVAAGQKAQVAAFGETRLDLAGFPTRHPYGLALLQGPFEEILAAWGRELGVRIERGREVTELVTRDDGADVVLDDGRTIGAKWVVGCDGGRSLVRKQAGIDFVGWDASVSYLIAEIATREPPAFGMRRDAKGTYAMGPVPGYGAGVVLREEEVRQGDAPTLEELRAALIGLYGTDFGLESARWISRFTDATRQAARYRAGRVLVAGDAAHVHAPNGGQGLNLGVQDAVNLGWKLGLVVRGEAPETLLDSYHAERHPVAARMIRTTMAQTALSRGDARMDAVRETVTELLTMAEPRTRYAAKMSGLDVHYDLGEGHPLLGRRMPDLDLETAGGTVRTYTLLHAARPVLLELAGTRCGVGGWEDRLEHVAARAGGPWELPVIGPVAAPSAVLIRPDGHVAWVGDGTDRGLRDPLERWLGPPRA